MKILGLDSKKVKSVDKIYQPIDGQKHVTFMSFRVVKKFFFKRPRIKFCLMRTMIMNKIERPKNLWRQTEQINIGLKDGI